MADEKPIIILKKKGGHGGHHGGAWKVAYADFVTAMMCFFMVMWLVNTADSNTKKNIAQYFRRPGIFERGSGAPLLLGDSGILENGYAPHKRKDKNFTVGNSQMAVKKPEGDTRTEDSPEDNEPPRGMLEGNEELKGYGGVNQPIAMEGDPSNLNYQNPPSEGTGDKDKKGSSGGNAASDVARLQKAAEELRQQLNSTPELAALLGEVEVRVGADGLHIEIMDTEKTSMFALGSAQVLNEAEQAFEKIATLLSKVPNRVDIVGHTDARPFRGGYRGGYSNWELSADRANAARRLLERGGIPAERITNVQGRADRELRKPDAPLAAANRRITLVMKFDTPVAGKVDLGQNPAALEHPEEHVQPVAAAAPQTAPNGPVEPGKAAPIKVKNPYKVHGLTAKDVLKENRQQHGKAIILPDDEPAMTNPAYMEKDKIFKDNPVFGPTGPLSGNF